MKIHLVSVLYFQKNFRISVYIPRKLLPVRKKRLSGKDWVILWEEKFWNWNLKDLRQKAV